MPTSGQRKIQLSNGRLNQNQRHMHHIYGLLITYAHKDTTIHYEVACDCLTWLAGGSGIFSFDRQQVFINNRLPDGKVYQLADELGKSLSPIQFHRQAETITGIVNHEDIKRRNKAAVAALSTYYEGEVAENCFRLSEVHCSNPNTIISMLENDFFYKLYFFPLYTTYKDFTASHTITLSPGGNHIPFHCVNRLNTDYNSKGQLTIDVTGAGETDHPRSHFSAQYLLYPEDHTIASVSGKITYPEKENKEGALLFELYHLNAEKRIIDKANAFNKEHETGLRTQSVIIEKPETVPVKKSFWDIFR